MENLYKYIDEIYKNYPIINEQSFIKNTNTDVFCPIIETKVAMFIKILLEIKKPKIVLELGTSIGYSTTIMAKTLQSWNGKVITIEKDKNIANFAKMNFLKYKVNNNIEQNICDAFEYLNKDNNLYDFIFLDLFNNLYPEVFELCIERLNTNGILLADDTLFPIIKKNDTNFFESNMKLDEFNKKVYMTKKIESVLLPLGDGVTLIRKT